MMAGGKLVMRLTYLLERPHVVKFITQLLHDGIEVVYDGSEHRACLSSRRKCKLGKNYHHCN